LPETSGSICTSRAWREVSLTRACIASNCAITCATNVPASARLVNAKPGARRTDSTRQSDAQPPARLIIFAPRWYDATSAPSVVAIGT
jgi:hypothetical protein